MDTPLEKIKKLTEMTRREFIKRGSAAAGMPKIPGQGLQSLVKEIPLNMEDLYRQQTKLKYRIIEYLGSTLGSSPDIPGGFKGIQHTLDSPEAREAGKKYWTLLMNQYRKLTDTMILETEKYEGPFLDPKDERLSRPTPPDEPFSASKPRKPKKSFPTTVHAVGMDIEPPKPYSNKTVWKGGIAPPRIVDRGTEFKTWQDVQKDYRDTILKQREKALGTTLITRSAGAGKTLPIGSTLPEALPSKPAPKKLEGPQTERTTKPVESKRTTKSKEPERKPKPSTSPRLTRTASPPPQFPSGKDLSRIALRGAANLAGWPMYAASFGIPSARSGESQVLAELADQPDADFETALKEYRQRLAQQEEALKLRRQQENLGPLGMS